MGAEAEAAGGPFVVAVVLTWNDTEMAGRCIESLLDSSYHSLRIVLVDNGSSTPCGDQLKERFASIDVVILPHNQGFTGGSNRGLERAIDMGADYILLLNNDTIVEQSAVGHLVEAIEERPDTAAASALAFYPGQEKRIEFFTGVVRRDCAYHVHPEVGELYEDRSWPTTSTDFVPAQALLFRTSALRAVGLFDESFGTCWEDFDLCMRFAKASWRLITVGDAHVIHNHSATTGRVSPYITYYFIRNRLICLFRHGRMLGILRNTPFILRSFWWQIKEYGLGNWPCHRAFVRGIFHFLLGIRGEGRAPSVREDRRRHDGD